MRVSLTAAWLFLAIIASHSAIAAEPGLYIGLDAGQSKAQVNEARNIFSWGTLIGTSTDDRDQTIGLHVGYVISPRFAIEMAYSDLGEVVYTRDSERPDLLPPLFPIDGIPDSGFSDLPPGSAISVNASRLESQQQTVDSKALSLSMIGRLPISQKIRLLGRIGIAAHKHESNMRIWLDGQEVRVVGGDEDSSSGAVVAGLGAEWLVHPNLSLRLQASRHFEVADDTVMYVSPGDITLLTGGVSWHF